MKKRTAMLLLGAALSLSLFAGCGKSKEATEAANESEATEKEGTGETPPIELKNTEEEEEKEEPEEEPKGKVGILLPSDETDEKWTADAEILEGELNGDGYDVEICYAGGDTSLQVSQIQEFLAEEVSALIVAPSDPYGLEDVLSEAKEKTIPVFAYDTLIMNTDAVKYYVTFDLRKIGQMIGENIVKAKELDEARENHESYNIEFLMGSPDESHALFLYNGIMEVLQSYFDDGTLVSQSQKTSFEDTAVMRWSAGTAETKLGEILDGFYQNGEKLDILCTASDEFAYGALGVLEGREILPGSEEMPYITGLGSQAEVIKKVASEEIGFTVFLDRRTLAEDCSKMVLTYLGGEKPEVTDYEQYDNGRKIIGTYTCKGEVIDKDNYEILIDNGYYEEDEIQPEPTEEPEPTATPAPSETPEPTVTPKQAEEPEVTEMPEPTKKPTLLKKAK
mgnify:FL=1